MNKIPRTKSIIAVSVAVLTFMVFLPSLRNEFVNWDDNVYVYENSFIRSLDTQLLQSAFAEFHIFNWHPLTWFSHAFDYAIWGLNPLGHHLTNNILHALNALLVVFLVMGLFEVYRKTAGSDVLSQSFLNDRTIMITGAATGLLFGLHPLHVESVAWVAERKDLLCAFFFLLTIITYTHYISEIDSSASVNSASHFFNRKYLFAIGFFALSLLSKPMAVTLPLVLLILDWHPFRRIQSLKTFWTASIEKLPFLTLTLISSILTILAQQAGGSIQSLEDIPLALRVMVAVKSLVVYLGKMMLPLNLVPYYPYPESISLYSLELLIPIAIVMAITASCIGVVRKQKLWMSVWSYYVITLIPVLGIVQVGGQSMADRYTYLPSIGPFFAIGFIAARVYENVYALRRWRVMLTITSLSIAVIMIVSMSYVTIKQIGVWRNSTELWNYVIDKEPGRVPLAHNNLGLVYQSKGFLDEAVEQYGTALILRPNLAEAHNNLGNVYASQGLLDKAMAEYQTAIHLRPDFVEAHYDLGNAYLSKGLLDMAIEHYRAALSLKPNLAKAHFNLGLLYLKNGSKEMARTEFELALTIKPDYAAALQVLNSLSSK